MTQIECPSCNAAFEVDDKVLTQSLDRAGQRHLRCGECKEIFTYVPKVTPIIEPKPEPKIEPKPELSSLDLAPDSRPEPTLNTPAFQARNNEFTPLNPENEPLNAPKNLLLPPEKDLDTPAFLESSARKYSTLTAILAFLILLVLLVLGFTWVSLTHPEWFQASYWLETNV
ncbi:MAG: MJ0042-type zinc finger domain-containing protein [Alphaproteobacteria bacterium]